MLQLQAACSTLASLVATSLISAAPNGLGAELPLVSIAPFVLLLLAIAILPLVAGNWWEHNRNKALVSSLLALPFAGWLLYRHGPAGEHALFEAVLDYLSFIALLGSLYVIAGGIHIKGSLAGSPLSNTSLLAIGAVLANLIGTTGASMVLIRPLLRANKTRLARTHLVVFFIFIVSNCAGLLTPLGDPPLYLGFLKGVSFAWTLNLWKPWVVVIGFLLIVFFLVDSFVLDREEKERPGSQLEDVLQHAPLTIEGAGNIVLLLGVLLVIIAKGQGWGSAGGQWPFGIQEALLCALAFASWAATSDEVHGANHFVLTPIIEVAVLFAAIFITMVAPLQLLNTHGAALGLKEPWHYFWATGSLSAFLDNAPTYLTFAAAACGQAGVSTDGPRYLADFLSQGHRAEVLLAAISCGAVMMGALTYIGNGPNFMVKSIAEKQGVKMPSFFHYMLWSIAILIPVFVLVSLLFFG